MEYLYLYAPPPKKKEGPTVKPKSRNVVFTWDKAKQIDIHDDKNFKRISHLFKNETPMMIDGRLNDEYNTPAFKMFLNMLVAPFQGFPRGAEKITKHRVNEAIKAIPVATKQEKTNKTTILETLKEHLKDFPTAT